MNSSRQILAVLGPFSAFMLMLVGTGLSVPDQTTASPGTPRVSIAASAPDDAQVLEPTPTLSTETLGEASPSPRTPTPSPITPATSETVVIEPTASLSSGTPDEANPTLTSTEPPPITTPSLASSQTPQPKPTQSTLPSIPSQTSMTADQLEGSIFASYSDAFAANVGQADERIDFLAQSDQVDFLFGSDTITLLLPSASPPLAPLSVIRPAPPMTPTPAFDAFESEKSPRNPSLPTRSCYR